MSGPAGDHVDDPSPGDSQDVIGGERLDSIETQLSQLTSIVKSLVGQRGDQVESSVVLLRREAAEQSTGLVRINRMQPVGLREVRGAMPQSLACPVMGLGVVVLQAQAQA
ncbi:unnamed protein product [Ectocarpus sp. CCAP 1310/34]|nr:unnamed protein product [Ectocarpus sp. CCAP 1310/34]